MFLIQVIFMNQAAEMYNAFLESLLTDKYKSNSDIIVIEYCVVSTCAWKAVCCLDTV